MSNYTYPLSDELQQRIEWLCKFHGIYKPTRLYIMRRRYYTTVGKKNSRSLLGLARGQCSIFLFPAALCSTKLAQSHSLESLPEEIRVKLAKILAHEFKHILDSRTIWSLVPYHKINVVTELTKSRSDLRTIFSNVAAWLHDHCHPFEIRANWYAFRHWERFYYLLWNQQYLPMEWFQILEMAKGTGGAAALFDIASQLGGRIKPKK